MRRMNYLGACFGLLFFMVKCNAQKLSSDENLFFVRTLDSYMSKHDYSYHENRKSEFVVCLFQVDSSGLINQINFLSDESRRDSTYAVLKTLSADIFKSRRFNSYAGKIIAIPVYSIASDINSTYIEKLNMGTKSIDLGKGFVEGNAFYYQVPVPEKKD